MAFCENCGVQTENESRLCPACAGGESAPAVSQAAEQPNPAPAVQTAERPNPAPAAPVQEEACDEQDARDNKMMGILAYILFLIPLLAGSKESKFVRYHTNQGLVLFIAAVAWGIAGSILSSLLLVISWQLALLFGGLFGWTWIVFAALAVIGILNAVNGKCKPLPVIGKISILK